MSMASSQKIVPLAGPGATLALGVKLAEVLEAGDVVALKGELGTGKTTLSRGLIQCLCGDIDVPSPTYTLLQTYSAQGKAGQELEIYHFDFYRLDKPEDCLELGLDDALNYGASLMEWPEKIEHYLPADHLGIDIAFDGEGRKAVLTAGPSWKDRLHEL